MYDYFYVYKYERITKPYLYNLIDFKKRTYNNRLI